MSPVVTDVARDVLEIDELERLWNGPTPDGRETQKINNAQLTITRNGKADFQDRQVYLFVDGEPWGKVKYGTAVSREIAPGRHKVRAFNTLFSHTIEVNALPGDHVKLRVTNGMPTVGWILMVFLHVTALSVKLERE